MLDVQPHQIYQNILTLDPFSHRIIPHSLQDVVPGLTQKKCSLPEDVQHGLHLATAKNAIYLKPSHQSTTVRPPGEKSRIILVNNKCWLGDPTAVMKSTNSSLRDDDDDDDDDGDDGGGDDDDDGVSSSSGVWSKVFLRSVHHLENCICAEIGYQNYSPSVLNLCAKSPRDMCGSL